LNTLLYIQVDDTIFIMHQHLLIPNQMIGNAMFLVTIS
jgi:hypothetical protein